MYMCTNKRKRERKTRLRERIRSIRSGPFSPLLILSDQLLFLWPIFLPSSYFLFFSLFQKKTHAHKHIYVTIKSTTRIIKWFFDRSTIRLIRSISIRFFLRDSKFILYLYWFNKARFRQQQQKLLIDIQKPTYKKRKLTKN